MIDPKFVVDLQGNDPLSDYLDRRLQEIEDRFWSKVEIGEPWDCWEWRGSRQAAGYGSFSVGRHHAWAAHRWAWRLFVGPIPTGKSIDHLCRNRGCVNPAHLEPVTPAENSRRAIMGQANAALQRAKTHCRHGHPFDESNTRHTKEGHRDCRTCARNSWRRKNWGAIEDKPKQTHCLHGHPRTAENISPNGRCATCGRAQAREYQRALRKRVREPQALQTRPGAQAANPTGEGHGS